jgi:uncharacterized protein with HEPN domain
MKTPRMVDLYISDMIQSMERIALYIQGLSFESFQKNFMVVDAVARNFEIIGEAARRIPDEVQKRYPNLPWDKMYQLRNIVSHAYFEVDYETIWKIASEQLKQNQSDLKELMTKEFPKSNQRES